MTYKEEFIQIYQENIKRSGSKELLDWLLRTDFLRHLPARNITAPVKTD